MFSGGTRHRTAPEFVVLLALLLVLPVAFVAARGNDRRTLSGIIYFTNNTPDDVEQFPVELYSRDQKQRVAATTPNGKHRFALTDLEPGKYLLKLTWPNHCVLWYRVDLTKQSRTAARIIMDVDCAHANGAIQDLPEN